MARRRRKKADEEAPSGGPADVGEILDDDEDDLDIRITSIEEELQNLLVSTQESVRDQRVVRARVDKLARDLAEDDQDEEDVFREVDALRSALQESNQRLEELSQHVAEFAERLSQLEERPLPKPSREHLDLVSEVNTFTSHVEDLMHTVDVQGDQIKDLHNRLDKEAQQRQLLRSDFEVSAVEFDASLNDATARLDLRISQLSAEPSTGEQSPTGSAPQWEALWTAVRDLQQMASRSPAPSVSVVEEAVEAPEKTDLGFGLKELLHVMQTNQATDLLLRVDSTPMVRLHGELVPVGSNPLGPEDCRRLLFSALSHPDRRRLLRERSLDFLYEASGTRLRGHAFFQRGRLCGAFKVLPRQMFSLEELGLPAVLRRQLSLLKSGLILVIGPMGSGKSTTLASMVDELNRTRKLHIITLEERLQIIHQDQLSLLTQRAFGQDFDNFSQAISEAFLHDPDVLVIDSLKDLETSLLAISAGDSGHSVLASLEAPNLTAGLARILNHIDLSPDRCDRRQLAHNLRAVICQRLLPRSDRSKGFVPASEVLLVTPAISQLLLAGDLESLAQIVQSGQAGEGSQSMEESLDRLVDAGLVSNPTVSPPPKEPPPADAPSLGDDAPLMQWL